MPPMASRLIAVVFASVLLSHVGTGAQTRVQTEIIKPPGAAAPVQNPAAAAPTATKPAFVPDVLTDVSALPEPVGRMRMRILEAARSGDLEQVVAVMQSNPAMPIFSLGDEK